MTQPLLCYAHSSAGTKVLDGLNEYDVNGVRVYGVAWNTRNYYSVREIVGPSMEGLKEGKLYVHGREIKLNDFIYTDLPKSNFEYTGYANPNRIPVPEDKLFVIPEGGYELGFVEV